MLGVLTVDARYFGDRQALRLGGAHQGEAREEGGEPRVSSKNLSHHLSLLSPPSGLCREAIQTNRQICLFVSSINNRTFLAIRAAQDQVANLPLDHP